MDVEGRRGEKREQPEPTSPAGKRHGGEEITMAALQRLMEAQTREIKEATAGDIKRAVDRLEAATIKRIDSIRHDVQEIKHHVSQQESRLDDVKRAQASLENRLDKLERSGGTVSTTLGEAMKKLSVVVGGWPSDFRKEDLLGHVKHVMERLEIISLVDKDAFCPGIRRGFAIWDFLVRDGEGEVNVRERMSKVIRAINTADYQAPGMLPGKKVWAGVSRAPRNECVPLMPVRYARSYTSKRGI